MTTLTASNPMDHEAKPILLLGAGELGLALLTSLTTHASFSPTTTPITLALRPSTLTSPSRASELNHYRSILPSIQFLGLDIAASGTTVEVLVDQIREGAYHTIIHANGMTLPPGSQRKLTDAVLTAGIPRYIPWQFGLDYDALGPEAGDGLFAEAFGVREALRSQNMTRWLVVSCGIFMSFLFEEVWGVVTRDEDKVRVRALGSWEDGITATTAEGIATVTAELVLNEKRQKDWEGNKVYIAGETLTYAQLADTVERVTGKAVVRDMWDRETMRREMEEAAEGEKKIWQYRAIFGSGSEGVSWPVKGTWTDAEEWEMTGVESWLRRHWETRR